MSPGHADILSMMNVYIYIGLDDVEIELRCMEEFQKAQVVIEKENNVKMILKEKFKVI